MARCGTPTITHTYTQQGHAFGYVKGGTDAFKTR